MRKTFFLLTLCFLSLGAFADSDIPAPDWGQKRLVSMTRVDNNDKATFKYDKVGRLAEFSHGDDDTWIFTYTDNQMVATSKYRRVVMNIADGIATSGVIEMGVDGPDLTVTTEYDNEGHMQWCRRKSTSTDMKMTCQWSGDNITSLENYNDGKLNIHVDFSFSSTPAPLLLQIIAITSDLGTPIALNNTGIGLSMGLYMGKLPLNRIAKTSMVRENKSMDYNYSYETNSNGDITRFSIGDRSYALEWENNPVTPKPSGISTITADKSSMVYSLSGQQMKNKDVLQKGIYIINKKKVVVRN